MAWCQFKNRTSDKFNIVFPLQKKRKDARSEKKQVSILGVWRFFCSECQRAICDEQNKKIQPFNTCFFDSVHTIKNKGKTYKNPRFSLMKRHKNKGTQWYILRHIPLGALCFVTLLGGCRGEIPAPRRAPLLNASLGLVSKVIRSYYFDASIKFYYILNRKKR